MCLACVAGRCAEGACETKHNSIQPCSCECSILKWPSQTKGRETDAAVTT